jgi:hypothetical protein
MRRLPVSSGWRHGPGACRQRKALPVDCNWARSASIRHVEETHTVALERAKSDPRAESGRQGGCRSGWCRSRRRIVAPIAAGPLALCAHRFSDRTLHRRRPCRPPPGWTCRAQRQRTRRASGPRGAGERSLRNKQKAAKHHHPADDARRCSSDLVLLKWLRHNEL